MSYTIQFAKQDTLAATLNSGATSTTLTTGNFGSPSGTQLYVVDYDVPAKAEIISASITTTAVTSITRGLSGGAAGTTDHAIGAKIASIFVPQHYAAITDGTGLTTKNYRARAYRNAVQSIPNAAYTKIVWNAESYDTNSNFDTSNGRYTVPVTGFYLVISMASIGSTATNQRVINTIYKNGTATNYSTTSTGVSTANSATVSDIMSLTAGDYIENYVYQDAGGARDLRPDADSWVSIHFLSAA
jgi:hypothetical protein